MKASLKEMLSHILETIYPVGSVYISVNNVNPADLFGGTWEQIKGRFLLATGMPDDNVNRAWGTDLTWNGVDKFSQPLGDTGGESLHKLSQAELPNIHGEARMGWGDSSAAGIMVENTSGVFSKKPIGTTYYNSAANSGTYDNGLVLDFGNGYQHNNMPPYLAVNMWYRTA